MRDYRNDNDNDWLDDVVIDEDEGFPSSFNEDQQQSYEIDYEDSHHSIHQQQQVVNEEEKEGGFAAEFYRCGTDWPCLLATGDDANNNNNEGKEMGFCLDSDRKLKQASLWEMWGLKPKNTLLSPPPFKKIKTVCGTSNTKMESISFAQTNKTPPVCPFYKRILGTPFTVDAFRYGSIQGCSAYFLTHFHCDHYGGLTKGWSHGPIYCTPLTARLVTMCLSVNSSFLHPLELNTEYIVEGVKVTLLEANHCPGAALIHFHLPSGECYLHTGDFRASKLMQADPLLINHRINVLYLDTTYCNPKYKFPSKEDALSYVVRVTKNFLKRKPKTLIVVGAYSIGKECVYLAISKALGVKIYANTSRRRILQSFGWPDLSRSVCSQAEDTPLHVLPISSLRLETLKAYLEKYINQYTAVLGFRPTGWTYSEKVGKQLDLIKPSSKGNVTIYGVPYSEHSSFSELREFVEFLKPDKIIPTVNIWNAANRDKMQSYFREWLKG